MYSDIVSILSLNLVNKQRRAANNNYAEYGEKRVKEDLEMDQKKTGVDCGCDMTKQIKGIVCDVKNCMYHSTENKCCAGTISVGPREASCSANTNCATFKPKEC